MTTSDTPAMPIYENSQAMYPSGEPQEMEAPRLAPDPVDAMLADELGQRRSIAAQQAEFHEESAARFRSVERACVAGMEQLANKPEQARKTEQAAVAY